VRGMCEIVLQENTGQVSDAQLKWQCKLSQLKHVA